MSSQLHPNAAITALNSTASPLLRLPAELRNQIYAYVFTGPYKLGCRYLKIRPLSQNRLALNITCRCLHAETATLPFTLGVFVFHSLALLRCTISNRLRPHQRIAIKNIYITEFAMNKRSSPVLKGWLKERVYKLTDVLPGVKTAAVVIEEKADWDTLNETRARDLTKVFNVTLWQWMESDGAVQITWTEK